jgi:hypothetical protein
MSPDFYLTKIQAVVVAVRRTGDHLLTKYHRMSPMAETAKHQIQSPMSDQIKVAGVRVRFGLTTFWLTLNLNLTAS